MKIDNRIEEYDSSFFEKISGSSLASAEIVLNTVNTVFPFRSVIDFGCGYCAWLTAAEALGASKLRGLDGPWVDVSKLMSRAIDFSHVDFEQRIPDQGKFDLAMSLEVAEHISETAARFFIDALCAASDTVLFGAAIPGQVGRHHVNLKWQSWWAARFEERGYVAIDAVRPQLWMDERIHWWYRQNLLIYCKADSAEVIKAFKSLERPIFDIVHPENYMAKHRLHFQPSVRHVLGATKNALLALARRR